MNHHRAILFCMLSLTAALPPGAYPQRKSITLPEDNATCKLKERPGVEKARAYCSICHSTDYIVRQPKMTAAKWQAEIEKMIAVFGAPISPDDSKDIAAYLAVAYGSPSGGGSDHSSAPRRERRGPLRRDLDPRPPS